MIIFLSHKGVMMFNVEFNTDQYIRETFFPDYSYKGTMIEVGAGPPEFISMSKHFRDTGWRCICVEPNPKFIAQHKQLGNEIYQYAASFEEKETTFHIVNAGWTEETTGISYSGLEMKYGWKPTEEVPFVDIDVKTIKLNTLLEQLSVDKVDFVSIDVEGYELEVMWGFDTAKYQPKVILLENYLAQDSYSNYMKSIGYNLVYKLEYNYIYAK